MQVVCATCQLNFDAPEGATGLVCPICRGPLRPQAAAGSDGDGGSKAAHEWSGGDLDDLIGILSAPAVSARVEVLGATGDAAIGEVHLLAGGVSDSIFEGKAVDDALDRLRALNPTRFRVEQRLPNPNDGNLSDPGPETGTLDGRALAHLMRYCEDYVISCAIDVWRGNETARVEYKRGEISGVTVGGIDAPERLAEVMQWSSGNYRLVVPEFKLPATAPKRAKPSTATPVPVPAPAPSAQAARNASSTKTIFGMPVAEVAKARAAAEAAKEATKSAQEPVRPSAAQPAAPRVATPVPVVAPAPVAPRVTPPGVAPSATPAPLSASRDSATKTIFGVPAPRAPEGFPSTSPGQRASQPGAPAVTADADSARTETAKVDRKMGARKVDVPAPAVVVPASVTAPAPTAPSAASPRAAAAPIAAPAAEPSEPQPTTTPGFDSRGAARKRPEGAPATAAGEKQPRRQTPIWTYVGVGFAFGLVLLGIYQLYGLLAH